MRTTKNGKVLAPVVDIFPHLAVGFHDEARVAEEMRLLKSFGFERVYFVLCNPGYPIFSNPVLCIQPPDIPGLENYSFKSIASLCDPNFAYLRQCHRHGMEAYAVIKPYEGGGGSTVPHGARLPFDPPRVECIGGERLGFDNLLAARPDLRVRRRPIPDYDRLLAQPVEKITADFCIEAIPGVVGDGEVSLGNAPVHCRLLISRDNGFYALHEGGLEIKETEVDRLILDANGVPLFESPKRCRRLELSGFSFPPEIRYFALILECGSKLHTIPQSMVSLHGPVGEIPSTVTDYMRRGANEIEGRRGPGKRLWSMEQIPIPAGDAGEAVKRIPEWGFEFEWYGSGFWGPGWKHSPAYGIARGKLQWMKGTPCEAYPEVREYWMDWVRKCIEMGFDGVDIRLQNHSGMVSDFAEFGYNEPLVEAYREKHGVDILSERADPLKLMAVRGGFFQEFIEQAGGELHAAGKKLQIHLRHCHEEPKLLPDFNELGFWAMPKIWLQDWRRLVDIADEITLKDYHFNKYTEGVCRRIKEYARQRGKRVWVHCYISQGGELNEEFLGGVEKDPAVGGVLLYEVAHSAKNEVNTGLIEQHGPVGLNEPIAAELRRLMSHFGWE